jgi:Protein of unknown function (DUF1684)
MNRFLLGSLLLLPGSVAAQVPVDLGRERTDFAAWLATAPNSPLLAKAFTPIGPGVRIGPADAEIPFPGVDARLEEKSGTVWIDGSIGRRAIPRNRLTTVGPLALVVSGATGKSVVTVFGGERASKVPSYYPYDESRIFTGPLLSVTPHSVHILTLDGLENDATEVGIVVVPDGPASTRLRVYRITDPSSDEEELTIYFRDATSGKGSYPAGRFVTLDPVGNGQYRLDFNRARNPFCSYSSAYPCPAPWPGNTLASSIAAGEQYHSESSEPSQKP